MTQQRYKICVLTVLAFVFSNLTPCQQRLSAQTGSSAEARQSRDSGWNLVNAEGEILITRNGKRTVIQNSSSGPMGISLGVRDMMQTGRGTAEFHLILNGIRTGASLKLGENTSVVIDKLIDEISFELLYGRLRIQSAMALSIKTGNSSVHFRECDAELRYIAKPGSPPPALLINCFRGEGELIANVAAGPEGARFAIKSAESLSLEYHVPFAYLERKSLDRAPLPSYSAETSPGRGSSPEQEAVRTEQYSAPQYTEEPELLLNTANDVPEKKDKSVKVKNGFIITGLVFVGIGSAMQGYSYIANPAQELRNGLFYGAYGSLGLGALFLIIAAAKVPARTSY